MGCKNNVGSKESFVLCMHDNLLRLSQQVCPEGSVRIVDRLGVESVEGRNEL